MPRGKEAPASKALVSINVTFGPSGTSILDGFIFTAPPGSLYELLGVTEVHDVAGSDGGEVTADIKRCASGTTVASGITMLASTFNMKSDADIPVEKTISNGGIATAEASRLLSAGQSMAIDFTGTLTALAGVAFTLWLRPLRRPTF